MRPENLQLRNPVFGYGFALIMVIAAVLLRYAIMPILGPGYHYVTIYPAIIIVAILAGSRPAILTSIFGSLMAEYCFSPGLAFWDIPAITIVILTGFLAGWLGDRLRKVLAQAQESQRRYRTLFDSIDEGFCIIEVLFDQNNSPIDYRFLEINPAFEKQTGLHEAQGKLMRQLAPEHEAHWFQIYGEIALTGKPARFVREAKALHRWYDVYAFRVEKPESRKVAILFDDISERRQAENALRESEEKFRMLAENARAIFGIVQGDRFIYVNPYLEEVSGYTHQELLQMPIAQIVHPDSRPEVLDRARRRQAGENVESHYEFAIMTKSQEKRLLDFSATKIIYQGEPAIVGIAVDITEARHAENELRQRSIIDEAVMANMGEGLYTLDINAAVTYVNPTAERILGFTSAELIGRKVHDILHYQHPDGTPFPFEECAALQVLRQGKIVVNQEDVFIRKGGQFFPVVYSSSPMLLEGRPIGLVVVFRDVTVQKQAQDALRESEEKFRMLAENAGAIIGIMQGEKLIYTNPYSQRTSGYSREELLEIDVRKLIHPDYQQMMMERALRRQKGQPIETHYEFIMVTKNGEHRWLDFSPIMIMYQGRPAIVAIAFDITERKRAQEGLVRIKEQLEYKNTELETIIGIVSHDLRAPLVNVKGFANEISRDVSIVQNTLRQEPSGENTLKKLAPVFASFGDSINFIASSAQAVDNLAKSLVNIARAGLGAVKPEMLDMNEVIAKVLASIKFKFKERNVSYDIDVNLPPCFGDRQQITQIFTNLLDNAVKYTRP